MGAIKKFLRNSAKCGILLPEMDLPTFIRTLGVDKAAELFEVKPRQVTAWMYGERKPRPKDALRIERATKGKVRFEEIYRAH